MRKKQTSLEFLFYQKTKTTMSLSVRDLLKLDYLVVGGAGVVRSRKS